MTKNCTFSVFICQKCHHLLLKCNSFAHTNAQNFFKKHNHDTLQTNLCRLIFNSKLFCTLRWVVFFTNLGQVLCEISIETWVECVLFNWIPREQSYLIFVETRSCFIFIWKIINCFPTTHNSLCLLFLFLLTFFLFSFYHVSYDRRLSSSTSTEFFSSFLETCKNDLSLHRSSVLKRIFLFSICFSALQML